MLVGINALSLDPNHKGGAESVFLNLVKGFKKNGCGKNIVYFCYSEMAKKVIDISPDSNVVIADYKGMEKHARISAFLYQSLYFHRIYKHYNLDLLFFANAEIGLFKYNIPAVVIPHDIQNVSRPNMNHSILEYYMNYWLYKLSFKNADRIIAISNEDSNEISKHYSFARSKITKIYNPIDVDSISITDDKQNYILAVNIQYKHKNIETLINAFSLISQEYPNLKLKLVGNSSEYTRYLEEYVCKHGLQEKIEFLGFVSKKELMDYFMHTRLYVNPSLFEGFGMTSVEAVLYGAPTLLGDIPVNREVTDNMCFYYKDPQNEFDLAREMRKILDSEYNIEFYSDYANKLLNKYKIITIVEQYWELFNSLCKI